MEKILPYKCRCGGTLKRSETEVELFGINFGVYPGEICTRCGAEYIDNDVVKEVQDKAKKAGLFGLERNLQVAKSGNSLVVRIPKEIADFLNLRYKSLVRVVPVDKKRLQVEIMD